MNLILLKQYLFISNIIMDVLNKIKNNNFIFFNFLFNWISKTLKLSKYIFLYYTINEKFYCIQIFCEEKIN